MSSFEPWIINTSGWTYANETWTYASATTFTVAGNQTAKYSKGTRLKLTQTTVKYFVVVGSSYSSSTTVTITAGGDYSLANAAITENYYSYLINPQGYPGWFNHTPTFTGFSADPTPGVSQFRIDGNSCTWGFQYNNGTSNSTAFTLTPPVVMGDFGVIYLPIRVYNNSADGVNSGMIGLLSTSPWSVYINYGGGAWTASNGKNANFLVQYRI